MVNTPIDATITFIPANIEVIVAGDDQVEYQGRLYKLSPFVGTFIPEEKRKNSGAYLGAKYFSYNGDILDTLRSKAESSSEKIEI